MRIGMDVRKIADFGIGTYIRGLLQALVDGGGDDTWVAFGPARIANLLPAGVERVLVDAPHYSIRELLILGRAAERARLDLFHEPHYVVPITKVPTVVTVHDLIHLRHTNPLARAYARRMIGRAVRRSRRVLTVSEAVKRDIVNTFGCDDEHVIVTPNGVGRPFAPAASDRPAGARPFLYVGNDKPHKNVDLLVDAAAEVEGVELVLVGASFDRFRSRPRVIVRGFVSDEELAELYRESLALVMPSSDEGFGLPALEAMASGCAVITSTAPALVEITGQAALHVAPERAALREALRRVASDETLRRALAQRGLQRAQTFTWKRCAELTQAVYHRAAAR